MMKQILIILSLLVTVSVKAQLTKIGNVDAYVYSPNVVAPILIAGHGNGEAAVNGGTKALLRNGFPYLLDSTSWRPPFPIYILCPQDGYGTFSPSRLPQLLADFKAKYPLASLDHKYITGLSAGGVMAFNAIAHLNNLLGVFPLSSASNDNSLVNKYAQTKTPVYFWVGEFDKIGTTDVNSLNGWTHYLLKQAGANSTFTIRKGKGHCCWNDIYQSAEFWNLIKPIVVVKPTTKITTSQMIVALPSKGWTVDSATTKNPHGIDANNNVYVMLSHNTEIYLSNKNESYNLHYSFKYVPPVKPTECYRLTQNGKVTILYSDGKYTGTKQSTTLECKGKILILKNNWTWEQK